jgi:hypothetical protein
MLTTLITLDHAAIAFGSLLLPSPPVRIERNYIVLFHGFST